MDAVQLDNVYNGDAKVCELSGKCYEASVKYVEEIERLKKELKNEH